MENWKVVNRDFQPEPGDAVRRINESLHNLTHHFKELGRLYVKDGTAAYGRAAAQAAAGGGAALFAWVLFVAATSAAVSPNVMPFWASIGIWTLLHAIAGWVLIRKSMREFKGQEMPDLKGDQIPPIDLDNEIRMRGMVP